MRNGKISVVVLMLAGLMLFASCKHEGFDVKDGSVQIPVVAGENSINFSVPVGLYDAVADDFAELSAYFNEDTILSEEDIKACEEVSEAIYNLDVFDAAEYPEDVEKSLLTVADAKQAKKSLKVLTKLTEEQQDELSNCFRGLSDYYDTALTYVKVLAELEAGESWFDSKEEAIESMNANAGYQEFKVVMPQFFPSVVFNDK